MAERRWVLITDERIGRLFRVERKDTGTIRVALEDGVRESWDEHQHGRPSPRTGKDGHSYASQGHEAEARLARFAKETAVWLEQHVYRMKIGSDIAVFAPPRFLGALREAWSPRLALRVHEHHGDLAHLSPPALARHPSIEKLWTTVGSE